MDLTTTKKDVCFEVPESKNLHPWHTQNIHDQQLQQKLGMPSNSFPPGPRCLIFETFSHSFRASLKLVLSVKTSAFHVDAPTSVKEHTLVPAQWKPVCDEIEQPRVAQRPEAQWKGRQVPRRARTRFPPQALICSPSLNSQVRAEALERDGAVVSQRTTDDFDFRAVVVQSLSCVQFLTTPIEGSTPGFPVLPHLLELDQTQVHWVMVPSSRLILSRTWVLGLVYPSALYILSFLESCALFESMNFAQSLVFFSDSFPSVSITACLSSGCPRNVGIAQGFTLSVLNLNVQPGLCQDLYSCIHMLARCLLVIHHRISNSHIQTGLSTFPSKPVSFLRLAFHHRDCGPLSHE